MHILEGREVVRSFGRLVIGVAGYLLCKTTN
jgi:hypothetical protein